MADRSISVEAQSIDVVSIGKDSIVTLGVVGMLDKEKSKGLWDMVLFVMEDCLKIDIEVWFRGNTYQFHDKTIQRFNGQFLEFR